MAILTILLEAALKKDDVGFIEYDGPVYAPGTIISTYGTFASASLVTAIIYVIRFDKDGPIHTSLNGAKFAQFDGVGSADLVSGEYSYNEFNINAKDAYSGSGSGEHQTSGSPNNNLGSDKWRVPSNNVHDATVRSNHVYHVVTHGVNTPAYFTSKWATVSP